MYLFHQANNQHWIDGQHTVFLFSLSLSIFSAYIYIYMNMNINMNHGTYNCVCIYPQCKLKKS